MRSELYSDVYKFEWDQRSQLISAVNIPIIGLTALATVLGSTLISFPYDSNLQVIFLFTSGITILTLFSALFFVLRSMLDLTYKKMPDPLKLTSYFKQLEDWHRNANSPEGTAAKEFQDHFNEKLAEAATVNAFINKKRGDCIYFAILLISISIVPCSLAGGLYVYANANQSAMKYHVVLDPTIGAVNHDKSQQQKLQQPEQSKQPQSTATSTGATQATVPSTRERAPH